MIDRRRACLGLFWLASTTLTLPLAGCGSGLVGDGKPEGVATPNADMDADESSLPDFQPKGVKKKAR